MTPHRCRVLRIGHVSLAPGDDAERVPWRVPRRGARPSARGSPDRSASPPATISLTVALGPSRISSKLARATELARGPEGPGCRRDWEGLVPPWQFGPEKEVIHWTVNGWVRWR